MPIDHNHSKSTPIKKKIRARRADIGLSSLRGDGGFPLQILCVTWLLITGLFFLFKIGPLPSLFRLGGYLDIAQVLSHMSQLTGKGQIDALLLAAGRALAVCIYAAVPALLTRLWRRLRDISSGSLMLGFWGVNLGAPLIFFLIKDFIWPLGHDFVTGF